MSLTLRRYRLRLTTGIAAFLLMLGGCIYASCTEENPPMVVFILFMLIFAAYIAHSLYTFLALRRAFADVLPLRGRVIRRENGIWRGTARIVIAYDGQEYATPAIFHRGEAREWVGYEVEFAFGLDGYVFVFRVL